MEDEVLKRDLWKMIKLGSHADIRQAVARHTQVRLTVAEQRLLELLINDSELRQVILPAARRDGFADLATASLFKR